MSRLYSPVYWSAETHCQSCQCECVFVCVCVFVFMHVFANVFGYALLFLFSNVQGCVYVCASLWLCVWESLCVCVWLLCVHECVFVAQRVCVCAVFCQEGKVHGP